RRDRGPVPRPRDRQLGPGRFGRRPLRDELLAALRRAREPGTRPAPAAPPPALPRALARTADRPLQSPWPSPPILRPPTGGVHGTIEPLRPGRRAWPYRHVAGSMCPLDARVDRRGAHNLPLLRELVAGEVDAELGHAGVLGGLLAELDALLVLV